MSTFFKRLLTIVVTLAMILTSSGVTTAVMAVNPADPVVSSEKAAGQGDNEPGGEDVEAEQDPYALDAAPQSDSKPAADAKDKASAEPQSDAGSQPKKGGSRAGGQSYIDSFYTQAFYGGSWKDTDDDGTEDHYVWTVTNSAAGHRFSFRINYKIGSQSVLDIGKVEIRIPKRVIKDRNGTFADEYEMSVPTKEEAEDGTGISSDDIYAYYEDGDEIVIYNFRQIDSEQDGYIEVSYLTSETSFYYEDMEEAGTFSAGMSVNDESAKAEDIHVMIDTSAKIGSVEKNYPTLSKSWNSSWGPKPADADDYWYLEWMITTNVDKTTTQPYTLSFSDVPATADMELVGYKLSGSSNYSLEGNSVSGQTRVGKRYDHVLTRVPKDPYGTVDAWTNSENKWKVTNGINVALTPDDGKDAPSAAKATRDFTYTFKDDLSSHGQWNHWKRSDGTYRQKNPKSVFHGSSPYDVFQKLQFTAGEYSRYDLDEFQNGSITSFDNFDYAVWGTGLTGVETLMNIADHNDPEAYFKNPVTYVLTDDDFNGDSFTAGARTDHHDGKFLEDGENRLELKLSEDFQIDKIYYNLYIEDAKYNEDEKEFRRARGTYKDDDIVDIYAKFGSVSADWVKIGSYNYGTGELYYDPSYVKSMTKKQIVLQDNCVSYKLTTSNAHYLTALGAVPYLTLKNSNSVLNYAIGKDSISLYNGSNFSVYTADEYDPAEGAAFKETQIFSRDRYDVDFATGAERSSDIVKSVVSAFNDSKARQYVISWQIRMEENLKSGADGTQEKVSQDGGVFYDLLPEGCTLDTGSVTVRSDAGFMDSGDFSVRQIMNYKNTGRTMLVVEIQKPGTNYNVYFNTLHSWASIVDYGHDVYNPTAYQTGNEDIADGSADDGGSLEEAALMKDLDPDNGDAERFIYAERKYDISTIIAAANGLEKLVREENDDEFSYSTFTTINGNYEYRLRYSCSTNMTTENLIFFDSLENYTDEDTESDWYGKLQNIDLSQPVSMGIKPVVYLRTDRFDVSTYDSDSDWDEVLASGWTEMSAFLAAGHTLEDAKAVAIDLRHDENGDLYNLDSLHSVSVLLHMKAPDNSPNTGGEERYPWAYNNVYLSGSINHTDGTTQPFYNHHDYTAVGLRITGDVKLLKVSADNETETIQGISFHLWGKSDYGTDVDLIATSNARGMVDFKNVEKGTYTLQEYETTDDWLIDPTEYKVVIDKYGNTTITVDDLVYKNERVKITDPPRVHGDLDFYKMSSVMVNNAYPRIEGVRFKLSGTSDYGNDVLVYATSSSSGVVSFTNIEKGTYELVEIETNEDYILNETVFHVQVDSLGGVSILNEDGTNAYLGEQSGTQIVFNPPRFWSFALIKLSKDGTPHTLQGAEFALTGTSNLGTVYGSKTETATDPDSGEESTVTTYDKYGVSDEHGLIAFEDIEAGTYKLFETKAPTGLNEDGTTGGSLNYQLDPTEYVVVIKDDGTVVIDGMEQDEDGTFLKGAWLVYNTLKLDKQITVYKHWDPSAPEEDYDWGERTADPEGEKNGPTVYISSKDPTAQSSDNGSSNNSNNNSSDDSSSPDNDSESNPADKAGTVSDAADRSVFAGGVSDASRKSVLNVVSDAWDAVSSMLLVTVNAADDDIASGTCGECSWVIDADGVLTISPTNGVSGTLGNLNSQTGTNNLWNSPSNRSKITKVYVEPGVKSGTGLVAMFFNCSNLTEADLHNLDTSNATSMFQMFCDCYKLTTLNISGFNTSKVTNMKEMFSYCEALENVDVSGFDTSKVTNMAQMFERCSSLQSLDVSGFNTAKVTDMHRMFLSCGKLPSLDVSGFDTAKVTDMKEMFKDCSSLSSLDLSSFDTSSINNARYLKDILSGTELKAIALGNKTLAAGNNWSSCGLSPTWIKYSSLTGKLAYNGETVDNIWDAKEYPGWYVKDVNNVPIDIDPYYEYVSEEDEQRKIWVKNGDVWSYTFFVADDTQPLYIWEDPVDGFSSSADVSTPIKYEPGTDQIISITNSSEETGSLELKKVVTGEGSGTFTFNITLTGNGIKGGQVFGDVAFYDGVGTVSLAGGESVTLTGIPVGTEYSVSEDTPAGYSASWEGDTSGTISKDNKVSLTCTNTPPSPPPEETVDLTVTKAVRGHFNNSGEYTFTATFGGLAAGIEYSYSINGADAKTYTADASGNANVTFTLKDSESAVFYKLPVGATYQITEDGGNWTASYTVTDSNGGDKIAGSAGSGSAGAALSTSTETADKDEDVTVAYTNVVEKAQDIKLIKRVKTVGNEKVDDEFAFTIVLNGLEPLAYYHTDIGTIRADNDGHAERQFSMKQDDEIFIYGLPVGATYRITESACPYIASFAAVNSTEDGEIKTPGAENAKARESLSTAEETVEEGEETAITFTNTALPMTEVSVQKVWDDANDKAGARPPSIQVQLYADGEAVGDPVVLNRTCDWKYTWTKLDVYKDASAAEPVKIVYTVDELEVPKNYIKESVDGNAEEGFTITNKYNAGKLKITKNLRNHENVQFGERIDETTFIFSVKVTYKGKTLYDDIVTMVFEEAGSKTVTLGDFPPGAKAVVQEIYAGGNYEVSGDSTVEVTIVPDPAEGEPDNTAEAKFVNSHNGGFKGGGSVENTYEKEENGGWKVTSEYSKEG